MVPIIIIWLVIQLSKIKYSKYVLFLFGVLALANYLININNYPMARPPTKEALLYLDKKDTKYIFTVEPEIYNNYLKTKKIYKRNNFKFVEIKDIPVNKKFWFICLNNPRFAVGNKILPTEKKCKMFENDDNFLLNQKIALPDIILQEYIKKN